MEEPKVIEEMLLKMKGECEESVKLLDKALAIAETPEVKGLREQWVWAQSAVTSILECFHDIPTRDLSGVIHCMDWFMICHSADLILVKGTIAKTVQRSVSSPRRSRRKLI